MTRSLVRTALVAALGLAPLVSHAAVLFSDDFNAENGGAASLGYTGFAAWTISAGSVDLIGNGSFDFYPGNGLYVDLDGSTSDAGTMTTAAEFALLPGTYQLSFLLGNNGNGSNRFDVSVGGAFSEAFTKQGNTLESISRTFSVTSATVGRIVFAHAGGDNAGAIIDDVKLEALRVVPEPSTWAFAALGLGLAAAATRRRSAA
ncbi:MAG: PEP-CTERM sorting domain-containing protein [Burkholderiales bacterium]|jgi:MYXO-CTERM domain-containing protein|nr:PEP-CTERM sorting domain-containing protein [Burkholderiales bacterium]